MATKTFCDRCKKETAVQESEAITTDANGNILTIFDLGDLCKNCRSDLKFILSLFKKNEIGRGKARRA
jgi:hypothetical protein